MTILDVKHLTGSVALAALLAGAWTHVQAQDTETPCVMVTDGSLSIYRHELAHCNGWWHEPFQVVYAPPPEFIHRFDGPLTVIIGEGWDEWQTKIYAQQGTEIILSSKSIVTLCKSLWRKHNISADMTLLAKGTRLSGCSVRGE